MGWLTAINQNLTSLSIRSCRLKSEAMRAFLESVKCSPQRGRHESHWMVSLRPPCTGTSHKSCNVIFVLFLLPQHATARITLIRLCDVLYCFVISFGFQVAQAAFEGGFSLIPATKVQFNSDKVKHTRHGIFSSWMFEDRNYLIRGKAVQSCWMLAQARAWLTGIAFFRVLLSFPRSCQPASATETCRSTKRVHFACRLLPSL